MEILVCVKKVPDPAENEIVVSRDGSDIERDDLVYSVNEWDNYAVEEAIQLVEEHGGSVTVVSVGDEESDEIIRRELAMGADAGNLLDDEAFHYSDGRGVAAILAHAARRGSYDLILTGAQAEDAAAQVGGMLAAMLDVPYASLVVRVRVMDGKKLKIAREIDGGNLEINEIDLPCALSIQTGINEPRYVGIRGIRKTASVQVPVLGAAQLGVDPATVGEAGAKVRKLDYFVPEMGEGAEILQGSREEMADQLIARLKGRGVIQ
ncbi:MAG: electron transfer flavoprotein subunit beta/FixA family protein [Proteobacteria bacterium]|nr:electron transfer flavoprotein subunit beta/FixA family protein [Pseudomonadota bacterium]MBU1451292.1 electron transfer flavoprotein subunit beta/FixA family protein [Pseudomonadota bacterium]MBU2468965.1 electron transfer flavoprotein subunit beta/FixA family protein [Pseudomonadota bacterium]MBU2516023.1 electron transfer flavoprotein subunit beta/FixA family protein [Pseudomonadota bacterium]